MTDTTQRQHSVDTTSKNLSCYPDTMQGAWTAGSRLLGWMARALQPSQQRSSQLHDDEQGKHTTPVPCALQAALLAPPDTQLQALCAVLAAGLVSGLNIQDVGAVPTQLAQHEQQPAGSSTQPRAVSSNCSLAT
jgi:hypothetical protein